MNFLSRLIVRLLANGVALYVSQLIIDGFSINPTIETYIKVAIILTLVNLIIRPVLKLVLSPLIFITFGLGIIVINALLLYGVDYFVEELNISGLYPLVYATLIISVVNWIASLSSKKKAQQ